VTEGGGHTGEVTHEEVRVDWLLDLSVGLAACMQGCSPRAQPKHTTALVCTVEAATCLEVVSTRRHLG
jgi:hypothetical protein